MEENREEIHNIDTDIHNSPNSHPKSIIIK